mmetsp:Transcript_30053/g.33569  ORF Transcript_30053/g.33569 Transcript_30053/m.33569 type:complete len:247 (+) Transcript_30053:529-1269(+)
MDGNSRSSPSQQAIEMRKRSPKEALIFSIQDAHRTSLTMEELTKFHWNFRYKATAGSGWTELDPWWSGRAPLIVRYAPNGDLERLDNEPLKREAWASFKWRFVKSTAGKKGPKGSFIQIGHFPAYVVSRHKDNWGFMLQSCWVIFTSWNMPLKPEGITPKDMESHDTELGVGVADQWCEAMRCNQVIEGAGDNQMDNQPPQHDEEIIRNFIARCIQNGEENIPNLLRMYLQLHNGEDSDDMMDMEF